MDAERTTSSDHRPSNKPDDGEWFRMSYRVIEALYSLEGLNKNHLRLILYIIRMTWGWNRRTFIFDTQEAIEATGIPKNRMTYLFKPLVLCNVIKSERGEYGVNKYIEEWDLERLASMTEGKFRKTESESVPKNGTSSEKRNKKFRKTELSVPKNGTLTVPKPADGAGLDGSKDNIKDKKDIIPLNPPKGDRGEELFEEAWEAYPKRGGGNSKKAAKKAWDARLKGGADPEQMLAGVKRYWAFCEATGKIGLETVKMAATFFGPDDWYKEPWDIPGQQSTKTPLATHGGGVVTLGLAPGAIFGWG